MSTSCVAVPLAARSLPRSLLSINTLITKRRLELISRQHWCDGQCRHGRASPFMRGSQCSRPRSAPGSQVDLPYERLQCLRRHVSASATSTGAAALHTFFLPLSPRRLSTVTATATSLRPSAREGGFVFAAAMANPDFKMSPPLQHSDAERKLNLHHVPLDGRSLVARWYRRSVGRNFQ